MGPENVGREIPHLGGETSMLESIVPDVMRRVVKGLP
jgi:hypothetical protein